MAIVEVPPSLTVPVPTDIVTLGVSATEMIVIVAVWVAATLATVAILDGSASVRLDGVHDAEDRERPTFHGEAHDAHPFGLERRGRRGQFDDVDAFYLKPGQSANEGSCAGDTCRYPRSSHRFDVFSTRPLLRSPRHQRRRQRMDAMFFQ